MQNFNNRSELEQSTMSLRGVWHRPNPCETERDIDELCRVLDRFKHAKINTVFLETFYHGMTVFKTDKVPYYKGFDEHTYGNYPDYLTAFVTEADKRGIKVHAWVQDFYIGYNEDTRLAVEHPDWILINQNGEIRHKTEGHGFGGYVFLDPANPEVRAFLISLYDELLTKVPAIAGLNLDYIRYPISDISDSTDTGYTDVCMDEFARKQGLTLDPSRKREDLVARLADKELMGRWIAHRAYYITRFVADVHELIANKYAGRHVSTAVFPELDVSYNLKKQTIRVWLEKKYIDMVTPMVYFYEADKVFSAVEGIKSMCCDAHCYTGLYTTYHKQTTSELGEHISASKRAGADGFVLFDAAKTFFETSENYEDFLAEWQD